MNYSKLNRPLAAWTTVTYFLLASAASANESVQTDARYEVDGSVSVLTAQHAFVVLNVPYVICYSSSCTVPTTTIDAGVAFGLGFNYFYTPQWSIGAFGNYQGFSTIKSDKPSPIHEDFFVLMGRTDFRWVNGSAVQLYSGLAVGGLAYHLYAPDPRDQLSFAPAFQLNLLGVHFGGRGFGAFVELGLGMNGLVAGGLSARF